MFIDINGSKEMSFWLPNYKFATIIQTFPQERSIAVTGYGGYVFKYEGLFQYFLQNMIRQWPVGMP